MMARLRSRRREQLARLAFMRTAIYDSAIFPYLSKLLDGAKALKNISTHP